MPSGARFEHWGRDLWTFEVDEVFKGTLPSTVEILTHNDSGYGGADCGGAHFDPGHPTAILARLRPDGRLWTSQTCGHGSITEAELRARADLRPPTGTGAIAALVLARDHDAGLLALNAAREVVAYGFTSADVRQVAPCPSHRSFLALDADLRFARWDAATMTSQPLTDAIEATIDDDNDELDVIFAAASSMLVCTDPEGLRGRALQPPDGGQPAQLVEIDADGIDVVESERAALALVPETGAILAVEGAIVGLRSEPGGELRPIASLPDGMTAVAAGVAPDGGRLFVSGTIGGRPVVVGIERATGTVTEPIVTDEVVGRNHVWRTATEVVASWSGGAGWHAQRIDLVAGEARDTPTASWRLWPLGDGALVMGGERFLDAATEVIEPDGSTHPAFTDLWDVQGVVPFTGPAVTREAATKVHADDLDVAKAIAAASNDDAARWWILGGITLAFVALVVLAARRDRSAAGDPG